MIHDVLLHFVPSWFFVGLQTGLFFNKKRSMCDWINCGWVNVIFYKLKHWSCSCCIRNIHIFHIIRIISHRNSIINLNIIYTFIIVFQNIHFYWYNSSVSIEKLYFILCDIVLIIWKIQDITPSLDLEQKKRLLGNGVTFSAIR